MEMIYFSSLMTVVEIGSKESLKFHPILPDLFHNKLGLGPITPLFVLKKYKYNVLKSVAIAQ